MQRPGGRQTQAVRKLGGGASRGGYGRQKSGLRYLVAHPEVVVFGLCLLWMFGCVKLFVNKDEYHVSQLKGGGGQAAQPQLQVPPLRTDEARRTNPEETPARERSPPQKQDQTTEEFPEHYMAFSTSCSTDQNWQSFVFFFYAAKVGQPGKVVRIASGCSQKEKDDLTEFHSEIISKLSPNFSVHFTPDFSKISGDDYKYYNKPFGLQHWMKHGLKFVENAKTMGDAIIMVLDPDMMLTRPITYDFTDAHVLLHASKRGPPKELKVTHGQPWASLYGFNNGPFRSVDMKHVFEDHTNSPALLVSNEEQINNYAGGPPYIATGMDMFAIVNTWCELVPRVHHVYADLLGEMYGWSLAAAHLRLPHTLAESFMVSATNIIEGEGWPLIDQLKDDEVCDYAHRTPKKEVHLPFVIHYCQAYWIGKYFVGKYRIHSDFMSCGQPLLYEPPKDIKQWQYDYFIRPGGKPYGKKEKMTPKTAKREQFMICQITTRLNDAAIWYKNQTCEKGMASTQKSFIFHHTLDPEKNEGGEKTVKW